MITYPSTFCNQKGQAKRSLTADFWAGRFIDLKRFDRTLFESADFKWENNDFGIQSLEETENWRL